MGGMGHHKTSSAPTHQALLAKGHSAAGVAGGRAASLHLHTPHIPRSITTSGASGDTHVLLCVCRVAGPAVSVPRFSCTMYNFSCTKHHFSRRFTKQSGLVKIRRYPPTHTQRSTPRTATRAQVQLVVSSRSKSLKHRPEQGSCSHANRTRGRPQRYAMRAWHGNNTDAAARGAHWIETAVLGCNAAGWCAAAAACADVPQPADGVTAAGEGRAAAVCLP